MTLPSDIFDGPSYNKHQHYLRVKSLFESYPLNTQETCAEHASDIVAKVADERTSDSVLDACSDFVVGVLETDGIYLWAFPDESRVTRSDLEDYERLFLSDAIAVASDAIERFLWKFLKNIPLTDDPSAPKIPAASFFDRNLLHVTFSDFLDLDRKDRLPALPAMKWRLGKNLNAASGYRDELPPRPKFVFPADSDLTGTELVETYFKGTPFVALLLLPRPFEIPTLTRFEHQWIIAPPGAGKSTTLQHMILRDLDLVAANKASIVVMESNRDLIKAVEGLRVFSPGQPLAGKLVTLDAEDVEYPTALNLFDVGMEETASYSPAEQEAFRNSVLSLYEYIFSALLSADLTSRQNTLFNFTIELLLAIPSATIDTLIELMQPKGIQKYQHIVSSLDPDARMFFDIKFGSKEFDRTKEQVVDRLFAVKRIRTLSRMFSAPRSKFDFFKEMGSAKVILINVPKNLLQEDGVEIVGRFYISMILLAAQKRQLLPREKRLPCYVYIDECQDFIRRDLKIPTILDQARKLNVGLILAHQRLQQLQPAVLDALYGATAIKFAAKLSDAAAHALARDMRTTPEFILDQPPYHFAAFIRGHTKAAVSIGIPATDLNKMPRMTSAEYTAARQAIRDRYAISRDKARHQVPAQDHNEMASDETTGRHIASENENDWRS